jgi:hypothetical protein
MLYFGFITQAQDIYILKLLHFLLDTTIPIVSDLVKCLFSGILLKRVIQFTIVHKDMALAFLSGALNINEANAAPMCLSCY